jgi:cysteine synthase A
LEAKEEMKVVNSVLDLIGNTPIVKLNRLGKNIKAGVFAKLEYLNPSGSIKDRVAIEMIEQAEEDGVLKPGYTIIESSTGNMGIALAVVGSIKGYKVDIYETMPHKLSAEKRKIMENFGARTSVITPEDYENVKERSIDGATVELPGRQICSDREKAEKNVWWARQFSNPANVKAHNKTGREILTQTDGKLDVFVAAVGTCGTLLGVAQVLKKELPDVRIVGVRPASAKVQYILGRADLYPKTDISGGIVTEMLESGLVDEIVRVKDEDAINMTHKLWKEEGLFAGISSGANVLVALQEAKRLKEGGKVATVLPDHGDRYLTEEHFTT